ncbi:hypothetical protein F7725_001421, partial [Dissostichus mawsoni]
SHLSLRAGNTRSRITVTADPSATQEHTLTSSAPRDLPLILQVFPGFFQCTNKIFLTDEATGQQIKEFARKNAANALSISNMVMGMASILSSLQGHHHAACWLVLIGYLLDLADGAVARRLGACSALGAKLDDFADFTTFGIATSLLLRTTDLMDNILASLLSGGNLPMLRIIAVAMILFMISQSFYPHDRVLESQAWKKAVSRHGVLLFLPPRMCVLPVVVSLLHFVSNIPVEQQGVKRVLALSKKKKKPEYCRLPSGRPGEDEDEEELHACC